ncbi:MAG: hypothetical protein GAK40_00527 [Burkholderia plantarii]|nr:MAG: hypothetical protein GAK40_00527 [Burkholderia plantarii]
MRTLALTLTDCPAWLARVRWQLGRALPRVGLIEVLACVAVLAWPLYQWRVAGPERDRLELQRAGLSRTLAAMSRPQAVHERITLDDVQRMRTAEQAYFVLDTLERNGLQRNAVTYRRDSEVKGRLQRLSIGIAMSGRYMDLRRALRTLADQPLLRVEALSIERKTLADTPLDIHLSVSLLGPDA